MRTTTRWLQVPALVTGLLLATTAVGFAQSPAPPKGHPHIEAAQESLKKAASELEAGGHNFGGHRAKALELVKKAQAELNRALAWAAAHPATPAKK